MRTTYPNPLRRSRLRSILIDALESRRLLAAPTISASTNVSVPVGKTFQLPIAGDDADNDALSYSVTTGSGVTAAFRSTNNIWLDLNTNKGAIRFQLFNDLAPNTVRKIRGLVDTGFYDGLNFHKLVDLNGYRYAAGGDPSGNGTGGPEFRFADEFHPDAIFSGTGQLAMSNGQNKDNNGSQFFVTASKARAFDFNYTIFGQMVRGSQTLDAILSQSVDGDGKPNSEITISSARIVEDKTDAVLQLRGGSGATTTSVTVNATDRSGNVASKTINVSVVGDAANNTPPILKPIPRVITAVAGQRFTLPIEAIDLEGDAWEIGGSILSGGSGLSYSQQDQVNKQFVFEAKEGFTGAIKLRVGVKGLSAVARGTIAIQPGESTGSLSIYDSQAITIAVGDRPIDGVPVALANYPEIQLADKLVARFTSQDATLDKSDFDASVDWGDGDVLESAKVEQISGNVFGVYGTHTYPKSATLPIMVTIESKNGALTVVDSTASIHEPFVMQGTSLLVRGTDAADEVEFRVEGAVLNVEMGSLERQYDVAGVRTIDVKLFDGDDTLESDDDAAMPNQVIDAGAGNDTLMAGAGADSILAGAGNDVVAGNGGNDTISGGDGNDSILSGSGKNYCYGDAGEDRITGSSGRDYLFGGDDSDRLYGRSGDDNLDGGGGTDRLYGEDGNDTLIGGASNDRLYGGSGDDWFFGKQGTDYLFGNGGTDRRGDSDSNDVLDGVI